jgi:hypothetical protein
MDTYSLAISVIKLFMNEKLALKKISSNKKVEMKTIIELVNEKANEIIKLDTPLNNML